MSRRLLSAIALASTLPTALAWGAMGHETVAYVATNFVASSTKTYFQSLLGDTSTDYLASVASWADSYRYTTAGKFSAPYHYIDANDSPPSSCSVSVSRDCGSAGCIVTAIANYTSQLLSSSVSTANKQIAAKMVVHFLGDVGQPLHCEALDVGGNDIDVTFGSDDTNLHAVWDTNIPEKIAGGSSQTTAKSWATTLTTGAQPRPSPSLSPLYAMPVTDCLDSHQLRDIQVLSSRLGERAQHHRCAEQRAQVGTRSERLCLLHGARKGHHVRREHRLERQLLHDGHPRGIAADCKTRVQVRIILNGKGAASTKQSM